MTLSKYEVAVLNLFLTGEVTDDLLEGNRDIIDLFNHSKIANQEGVEKIKERIKKILPKEKLKIILKSYNLLKYYQNISSLQSFFEKEIVKKIKEDDKDVIEIIINQDVPENFETQFRKKAAELLIFAE